MAIVMGISLYISRVTLQNLGVEDFGIYNVVCGFVTMFTFLSAAMTSAIQRYYNFELGKNGVCGANKVFLTSLLSQALLAGIILTLLESIGLWYINHIMIIPSARYHAAKWIFQMSVLSVVFSMFQAPFDASIMAHEKMGFYAFLSILNQVLKLSIVLSLPFLPGDKLITYGYLFLLVSLIDLIVSAVYSRLNFAEIRFRRVFHRDLLKDLFAFSGWNILGEFALTMKEQGLNMILNLFFGPVVNAARGLAFQVTNALNGFVANFSLAVKPQLTQSYAQGNKQRAFSLMFSNTKIGFIVLFLLALPVCLEIDFILRIWLGAEVPEYTNSFIVIVFLITLFNGMQGNISFVIQANGDLSIFTIVTSLITLLILPLSYFALKSGKSPNSVFGVSLIITILNYIISVLILLKIVPFSLKEYFLEVVLPLFIMAIVALPIPIIARIRLEDGWWRLIVVTGVSVLSTAISAYCLGLNKKERQFVNNFIQTKVFERILPQK